MQSFDSDLVGSLFTRVEMAWPKNALANFDVIDLGHLSLIRSTHTACSSTSRRLERHMVHGDADYHFACLPLDGFMEMRHLGWNSKKSHACVVKSSHLAFLNSAKEYEIKMSEQLDAIWLRIPSKILCSHAISPDDLLGQPLEIHRGLGLMVKQMMCSAIADNDYLDTRIARVFSQSLLNFLGEIANLHSDSTQHSNSRGRRAILKRAQDFIENHIEDENLSPQIIAHGIGISLRYLSEIFAAENTSPMRWVTKRRLELCRMEFERQTKQRQMISEVAYSMGFTNISSFNRAFKIQFGHSPRDIIAKNLNATGNGH